MNGPCRCCDVIRGGEVDGEEPRVLLADHLDGVARARPIAFWSSR